MTIWNLSLRAVLFLALLSASALADDAPAPLPDDVTTILRQVCATKFTQASELDSCVGRFADKAKSKCLAQAAQEEAAVRDKQAERCTNTILRKLKGMATVEAAERSSTRSSRPFNQAWQTASAPRGGAEAEKPAFLRAKALPCKRKAM